MGRGYGRGRGGGVGRRRGRGGFHNKRKETAFKESDHLRQFGEKHPSQEMQDFGRPSSSKRGRFNNSGTKFNPRFHGKGEFRDQVRDSKQNDSSSESDEEEESTPYQDLLTVLSSEYKKRRTKGIEILSESDDSDEGDDSEVGKTKQGSANSSSDSDDDVEQEKDTQPDSDSVSNVEEVEPSTNANVTSLNMGDVNSIDDFEDNLQLEEETVINEAELDSDYSETEEGKNTSGGADPFTLHFERELSPQLLSRLQNPATLTRLEYLWPAVERFIFTYHSNDNNKACRNTLDNSSATNCPMTLDRSKPKFVEDAPIPQKDFCVSPDQKDDILLQTLFIKSQIRPNVMNTNKNCLEKAEVLAPFTPLQTDLLGLMGHYHDIYFSQRTFGNEEELRNAYCFHVANHITKVRSRILHHNARMANKIEVPDEFRDQGFVRPKALILVPFKESALKVVKTLISCFLTEEKGNVQNKKRFVNEFGGETLFMPKTNPKPEDYMATFAGNVEDNFKIGLAITRKSIKLYTGFYASDIIIASPLGLRLIIGAEGEKNRDYDFLSSIEVLVMDQADIFLMQNWDHVLHLIKHMHLQPLTTHGTDFSRIRPWAVEGQTKLYCQTLLFSSIMCPEHNSLLSKHCKNFAGLAKIMNPISKGTIAHITSQLPQVFHQFSSPNLAETSDARFNYFVEKILPNFTGKLMSHTLIFVSSYFDFVKLRNYFKKEEKSFVQICEYTKDKKIARARDLFFHGKNHFLVYTERAHFFRRHRLKGIGHIIFYQLPQYPIFYSELCNQIQSDFQNRRVRQRNNSSVNVLYCKYDASRLAGITGDERCNYMLSTNKKIHAFVSGS